MRKKLIMLALGLAALAATAVPSSPALAVDRHHSPCPKGWTARSVVYFPQYAYADRDGDGAVCTHNGHAVDA
jgi:hypothetical protein